MSRETRPRGRGELTPESETDNDTARLVFRRELEHAPDLVWDAISTPEGLREWLLCTEARIDGRVGGWIELVSGPAQYRSTGQILMWDPPHRLEYEWNVDPVAEMPQGEHAIFRYELAPFPGGTRLTVTYRRLTQHTAIGFLPGLHAFLDRLEAQLNRQPLPDWMARFVELRDAYPEWSEHATHAVE